MFPQCRVCGVRHDPRQPKCNLEDRIAFAREKAGLPPLIPVNDVKPVVNKSADKAQRIVKARAVVPVVQMVVKTEPMVVKSPMVVKTESLVDSPIVHESRHGKYADAEKRKAYQEEWYRQKVKADKQKAQS